jgi:hypothetical protein
VQYIISFFKYSEFLFWFSKFVISEPSHFMRTIRETYIQMDIPNIEVGTQFLSEEPEGIKEQAVFRELCTVLWHEHPRAPPSFRLSVLLMSSLGDGSSRNSWHAWRDVTRSLPSLRHPWHITGVDLPSAIFPVWQALTRFSCMGRLEYPDGRAVCSTLYINEKNLIYVFVRNALC